jgi:hypothetical protein
MDLHQAGRSATWLFRGMKKGQPVKAAPIARVFDVELASSEEANICIQVLNQATVDRSGSIVTVVSLVAVSLVPVRTMCVWSLHER